MEGKLKDGKLEYWLRRVFWIIPLMFYWYSACPYPGWIDSPMIVNKVYTVDTSTWVNSHNLFFILGKLWTWIFPFGELHYRLNLLCGVFAAVGVHFLFLAGLTVTRHLWASLLGALAIMVSHSLWWHATMLEVYTLNIAFIGVLIYLVARYERERNLNLIYTAGFLWGVGCLNHALMGLLVLGFFGLFFLSPCRRDLMKPKVIGLFSFFVFIGFQLYLFLFLKELNQNVMAKGEFSYGVLWDSFKTLVDNTTGGHFKKSMFPEKLGWEREINWRVNYIFLLLMNFPSVFFPLGFIGVYAFKKIKEQRATFIFVSLCLIAEIAWSANYLIWDMYAFGMPVWVMFGFLSIVGLAYALRSKGVLKKITRFALPTIIVGPILYATIPTLAKSPGFWSNYFGSFVTVSNYWDAPEYFANPYKRNYDLVKRLADSIFAKLPPGAHLFDSDGKGHYPFSLYYQKVLGKRPDLNIYLLFSPEFDDAKALQVALRARRFLESNAAVYVASLYWPERLFLNHLYANLANNKAVTPDFAGGLSIENFEKTFPQYELQKVPLLEDGTAFIYKFVKRGKTAAPTVVSGSFKLEGENLRLSKVTGKGWYLAQALGDDWSGGGHLLWLDAKEGDEMRLEVDLPISFTGEVRAKFTKSYDFGSVVVNLENAPGEPKSLDLYAPKPSVSDEVVLAKGKMTPGRYIFSIKIIGRNEAAEPRYGAGLDYIMFKEEK